MKVDLPPHRRTKTRGVTYCTQKQVLLWWSLHTTWPWPGTARFAFMSGIWATNQRTRTRNHGSYLRQRRCQMQCAWQRQRQRAPQATAPGRSLESRAASGVHRLAAMPHVGRAAPRNKIYRRAQARSMTATAPAGPTVFPVSPCRPVICVSERVSAFSLLFRKLDIGRGDKY